VLLVVTEIVFSIVASRHLTFHKVV